MTKLYFIFLLCALTSARNLENVVRNRRDANAGYQVEQVRTGTSVKEVSSVSSKHGGSGLSEEDVHKLAAEENRRKLGLNYGVPHYSPKLLYKPSVGVAKSPKYLPKYTLYGRTGDQVDAESAAKQGDEENESSQRTGNGDVAHSGVDADQARDAHSEASEAAEKEAENARRYLPYIPGDCNCNCNDNYPYNPYNPYIPYNNYNPYNPYSPYNNYNPYNPCDPCNNCSPILFKRSS